MNGCGSFLAVRGFYEIRLEVRLDVQFCCHAHDAVKYVSSSSVYISAYMNVHLEA